MSTLYKCQQCAAWFQSDNRHTCGEFTGLSFSFDLSQEPALRREPLAVDIIANPPHYTKGTIQPIDFIVANNLDFCSANVVKYVVRHKFKNGVEDLKKARFYIDRLIQDYGKK